MEKRKRVYIAASEADAILVAGELRAAGIDATVQRDVVGLPSAPFASVWVPSERAEEAQQHLNDTASE